MTTDNQPFTAKPLYKMLATSFPTMRTPQGIFDVKAFAKAIGMSAEGVYKWLRAGHISTAHGARKIVKLADDTPSANLKVEQLYPFILR